MYWNDKVAKTGQPMPVVIWLHPFAFNRGYSKFSHLTMFLFFHFVSLLDMCVVFLQLIMNTALAPFFVFVIDMHTTLIICCHHCSQGPTYGQSRVWEMLASAGVVVVTYEQIGFGGRVREGGTSFYARNGNRGSLLGHMVGDVSAVVDFLLCHAGGNRDPMCNTVEGWGDVNIPRINPTHIFAAGYSLGGAVSLHAAALDKRIARWRCQSWSGA